jgi:RNA 3'-terminal phosphate cyclase (ATP)
MLTIDGSYGEGGGQLVRNAVALSAITGIPITIVRVRAARKNPGLAAQHVAAVSAAARTCDAVCTGVSRGSQTLTFSPHDLKCCHTDIAVGTAGSVPLVIQAWLPVALSTGGSLHVTGGTEVPMSPTIDYLDHVLCGVLRNSGADIGMQILRRGYYPEGGGEVRIDVKRKHLSPIRPISDIRGPVCILSCSSHLPDHVAGRQASAAEAIVASGSKEECRILFDRRAGPGTGSSCTVWKGAKGGLALGRRGVPAESVGEMAARSYVTRKQEPGSVDCHLSDQLLVPLALFGGSFTAAKMTTHAETICWLLAQFGYRVKCHTGMVTEYSA